VENTWKISMEKVPEKCPECGKKVKFLRKHIKRSHLSREKVEKVPEKVENVQEKVQEISLENSKEKGQEKGPSFLKEIKLLETYEKMTDTITPKKEENKEAKYKCGGCGGTFNERHKRCPHCGVEFE
jgi:DNA-directed RNA polymerase subunit RPC12/RpoP